MFELIQLEQLVAIADFGTVSKAAEQLHISQPALSRSIQHLEEELGISLFDRHKNRVSLNENGILAVEYARKLLDEAAFMATRLKAFAQKQQTISVGSVSPTPLWRLTPILSDLFSGMTLQSEVKETEGLLEGLMNDHYQIVITTERPHNPLLQSWPYLKEQLYIAVLPSDELSSRHAVSLKEINGKSVLRLSRIRLWDSIYEEKMPDSLFPILETVPAFFEVAKSSTLPYFATNLIGLDMEGAKERIYIPVNDPEVHITFYCVIKKADAKRLTRFVSVIEHM